MRVAWQWILKFDRAAHHRIAVALAVATFGLGLTYATTVAGGSDSYGYISQADLWIRGDLKTDQTWAQNVPWPLANWTFAPLGYHPSERPRERWVLTPTYSPGLPLLMAAAKLIGGQEAVYWVVPIMGALLVLATYGIGCRLASPTAGLIGAWLVATSPAVLFELMAPMTDVPVAAAWAVSFYFLLGNTAPAAALAGLAAAVAVLIRPNLAFGAIVIASWYALRLWRADAGTRRREFWLGAAFFAGVLPGIAVVALINNSLNGSPWRSGYGSIGYLFALGNFWPNARQYAEWLIDSQTPIVVAGLAAIVVPLKRLWPAARDRAVFVVINGFVIGIWVMYCFFQRSDVWWYLRFLLASWPFLMLGVGAVVVALTRPAPPTLQVIATTLVIALGVYEMKVAADRNVFDLWKQDRHYVSVARLARSMTEPNSVIVSMLYSGSVRYYGGRVTLRFDLLDERWLDRAVSWLTERGVHTYLLANESEMTQVRARFSGQQTLQKLEEPPVFVYQGPATVRLYDLSRSGESVSAHAPLVIVETYKGLRSMPPVPLRHPTFD